MRNRSPLTEHKGRSAGEDPTPVRVIDAGWMVDGTGGPVLSDIRLRIRGERILAVDPGKGRGRDRAEPLDLSGCTIMPFLVDSHVHLFMSGTGDPARRREQLAADFDRARGMIAGNIRAHLSRGVIAVRDGGDRMGHVLRYKREVLERIGSHFYLSAAGRAWHAEGRYGRMIARAPKPEMTLAEAILSEPDPADHVKIVNSGLNSLIRFGQETRPQFGLEELADAVAAAARRGRSVMAHANGKLPVGVAIAAGCASIEHGFFMGTENLERMAESGIVWIPTACTMSAYARKLPPGSRETDGAKRNLAHQLEQLGQARRLGVPVAVGTDAGSLGVDHGTAVIEEIRLLLTAGYTLPEAVRCGAYQGAALLGLEGRGLLIPETAADFIAVEGPPGDLPESLARIRLFFHRGRPVDPPIIGESQL